MFGRRSPRPASAEASSLVVTPRPAAPAGADDEARRAQAALEFLRRSGTTREEAPGSPVGREWRELKRRQRRRTARRTAAWLTTLAVAIGLTVGGWLGGRQGFAWLRGHTDLFRARSIEVSGVERLGRDEVVQAAGLAVGQDLIALRPDSVRAALARLPRVKSVTVDRNLRREIRLAITERKPSALILLAETWEIDDEGVLLPADASGHLADLPVIVGLPPETAVAGACIDPPGLKAALRLAGRLAEAGLLNDVSDINVARPDSLLLVMQPEGVLVRAGDGDVPVRRLQAMQAARGDLKLREIDPAYLDVRFAGLIVAKPLDPGAPIAESVPAPVVGGVTAALASTAPVAAAAAAPVVAAVRPKARTAAPTLKPKAPAGKPGAAKPAHLKKIVKPKPTPARKTVTGKAGKPAPKKPQPAQGQRRPHGQHT